jgi:gliding motility-associated-like protein
MKKLLLIITLGFLISVFFGIIARDKACAQNPTFRESYDVTLFDIAGGMVEASSGDYVFAGGGIQAILTDINNSGVVQWSKNYNSGFVAQFNDLKKVSTGGYILCGTSSSGGAILTRVDVNGNLIWSKKYQYPDLGGKSSNEYANAVIETSDGGFLVGGGVDYFWDGVSGSTIDTASAMGFKVDASGNLLWNKVWPITNTTLALNHYFNDVAESADGYFFVGESEDESTSSGGNIYSNALFIKTNTAGVTQYIRRWGYNNTTSQGINSAVRLTIGANAGKILLGGYDDLHAFLITVEGAGGVPTMGAFNRRLTGNILGNTYILTKVMENPDGNYSLMGTQLAFLSISLNTMIVKLNSGTGALMFGKSYAPIGLSSIIPKGGIASDAGFYTCQLDQQFTGFNFNVIRTDASGNIGSGSTGCSPASLTPTLNAYAPTLNTPASAEYTSMVATTTTPVITTVTPTATVHCLVSPCVPPAAATTVTATPNPICAGQSTTITASGPASGVTYYVFTTATGGTTIGACPLSVSPGTTTTYYVETSLNANPTCVSLTRTSVVVTVNPAATAYAGLDATICFTGTYTVSGATATNYSSINWTTSGTGSFTNNGTLTPTYTPSAADIAAGFVTLTLTSNGNAPCSNVTDQMTLTINQNATANAGSNASVCAGSSFTVSGATATYYTILNWTTSGTGSFTGNGTLTPTYTPSPADIIAGSVTLTLTATASAPCSNATDNLVLTIVAAPTADAGPNASICFSGTFTVSGATATNYSSLNWTTSGTGSFTGNGTLTPTYTPSPADITAGFVTLTLTSTGNAPCSNASDVMTLTISQGATANAGSNASICAGSNYTISGATASNYNSLNWTTSGTGSFTGNGTLTPTYTPSPADILAGSVILTLTATPLPPCSAVTDNFTLTIVQSPTINTGPDTSICASGTYTVTGFTASDYNSLNWTTSGTGSFSGNGTLTPTYTPSPADILAGSVILTLTATGNAPCSDETESITLTFIISPFVDAGANDSICSGSTFTVFGATASNYTTLNWTTSGTGSFTGNGTLTPTYTPSAADIAAGTVTLTLTAPSAGSCPAATDIFILTIVSSPLGSAGNNDTVCFGNSYTVTGASASNYGSLNWTSSGTGTFTNNGTLSPTYDPSTADSLSGSVTLYLYVTANSPCADVSDSMVLYISTIGSADAGSDTSICPGGSVTLNASGGSTFSWTPSTGLSATNIYNPVANPTISTTYIVTVSNGAGCTATDDILITVNPSPNANAGADVNICSGDGIALLATGGGSYSWSPATGLSATNIANPIASPLSTTTYTVTVTNSFGCSSSDMITLTVYNTPIASITGDTLACSGSPVILTAAGGLSYLWNTSATSQSITVFPVSDSTCYVIVSNGPCSDTAYITVNTLALPVADAGDDITANIGETVQLNGSGGITYLWSPSSGLSDPSISDPTTSPTSTTVYTLVVTDNNGCTDMDMVTVNIEINCGTVFVPNIFSPNGDGNNDILYVRNRCIVELEFIVYDRWGEKVFETSDVNNGWDGEFKGKPMDQGVFVYYLKAVLLTGEEVVKKGNISLMR